MRRRVAEVSARANITIPAEVKRRMEKVKEPVNWSAVACKAFREKCAELERLACDTPRQPSECRSYSMGRFEEGCVLPG